MDTSQINQNLNIKPFYKRSWFIILVIAFVLIIFWIVRFLTLVFIEFKKIDNLSAGDGNKAVNNEATINQIDLYTTDDPSLGDPQAPIKIVEFSDFECPFCSQSAPIMREVLANYSDKVYYIYRDFPIDSIHSQARLAAEAGECAGEQEKFWPWHNKVFQNQDKLALADLLDYAQQVGMDMGEFATCLESGRFRQEVENDLLDGIAAGVEATPTFFVNGKKIEGVIPLTAWEQVLSNY